MTRLRRTLIGVAVMVALLLQCSPAFAVTHGGVGLFGPTSYMSETNAMFILMGFIISLIIVLSFIQAWLDHRKHARLDAAKHRAASEEWKGGW